MDYFSIFCIPSLWIISLYFAFHLYGLFLYILHPTSMDYSSIFCIPSLCIISLYFASHLYGLFLFILHPTSMDYFSIFCIPSLWIISLYFASHLDGLFLYILHPISMDYQLLFCIPSLSIISLFLYITSLCILHPIFLYYFSNFGHFLSLHFASLCVISLYFASPVSVFSLSVYLTRWAGRGVNDLGVEEEEDGWVNITFSFSAGQKGSGIFRDQWYP